MQGQFSLCLPFRLASIEPTPHAPEMPVDQYRLAPTALIPNSPQPLLHYRGLLAAAGEREVGALHERLAANGWNTQWIFRYGPTQAAHYHSATHECMAVLSGTATIRFGAADADDHSPADASSPSLRGGIELPATAGARIAVLQRRCRLV